MKSIYGARWVYFSQLTRLVFQVVGLYLMTKLVKPSDYGLFSLAGAISNFALLFRDIGAGALIIKSKNIDQKNLNFLFVSSISVGVFSSAAVIIFSFFADDFFYTSGLFELLIGVAVVFPVISSCVVPQALMEKNINFSMLARIEIFSSMLGVLVGIIWAKISPSAWCFLCPFFFNTVLTSVFVWIKSDWRPSLAGGISVPDGVSSIKSVTTFNVVNYFYRNVDVLLVGKFFGALALAGYSLAYRIMTIPLQLFGAAVSRIAYPRMVEIKNSGGDVCFVYINIFKSTAILSLFSMVALFVFRDFIHIDLLDGRFENINYIIGFMCPIGVMQAVMSTTGPLLMVFNKETFMLKNGILNFLIMCSAFLLGVNFSLKMMMPIFMCATLISFYTCIFGTVRIVGDDFRKYFIFSAKTLIFFPCLVFIEFLDVKSFLFGGYLFFGNFIITVSAWVVIYFVFKGDFYFIGKFFGKKFT